MSMTDPIADLLTRIRNAQLRQARPPGRAGLQAEAGGRAAPQGGGLHQELPGDRGSAGGTLRVFLRYSQDGVAGDLAYRAGQQARPPGLPRRDEIQPVRNGLGIGIVSTSQGLLTDRQARERRVGGELLCEVW